MEGKGRGGKGGREEREEKGKGGGKGPSPPPQKKNPGAATGQILRLECTKFDFGWGSAQDPAGGADSALPDPLAGFNGPTSKGREEGEGKGRGGEYNVSCMLTCSLLATLNFGHVTVGFGPIRFLRVSLDKKLK